MRGDRLMRIGAFITSLGMVCGLYAMLPLVFHKLHPNSALWPFSMFTGVGLLMVLLGLRRSSRVRKSLK